jgi:SAM-dependent methyltransferase
MEKPAKDVIKYYFTCRKYFAKLSKTNFDEFSRYYSALKPAKKAWVLDVGCGVGQVVNQLANEEFYAIGIDISPIGIRMASRQHSGCFLIASATNLPFRNGCFQAVGCRDFLEHTHYPDTCLKEIGRVAKSGGKVVISAPNFLRVIGHVPAYHPHIEGVKQRMYNLNSLIRKVIYSNTSPEKMHFEFMKPALSDQKVGSDADAVCITNPIDIKFNLRKLGVRISYMCASVGHGAIMEKLGRLPLIRTLGGGVFIIGFKTRKEDRIEECLKQST